MLFLLDKLKEIATAIINYYNLLNAANFSNEVNATNGFSAIGNTTVTSINDVFQSSNYSIEGERLAGGGFNTTRTSIGGLTIGKSYAVKLMIKKDSANVSDTWLFAWGGITQTINQTIANTTYQETIVNVTMSATVLDITIYPSVGGEAGSKYQLAWIIINEI